MMFLVQIVVIHKAFGLLNYPMTIWYKIIIDL
jgi:hypothetical protein